MADLSDVEDALADLIAPPFYPNGPDAAPAIDAAMVKIYPGWPQSDALDKDVRKERVNVSIFASKGEKNVTRYMREWRELSRNDATLTATVSGNTLTIGGTVAVDQNVHAVVAGRNYVYAVQAGDTLQMIAAALAALINVDTPASAAGNSITADHISGASIGVVGKLAREVRRTEKQFMVTIWAPSDALRVAAAKLIDPVLSAISYLPLKDGSKGFVTYVRSDDNDDPQEALIYRRDIVFMVEYPTLEIIDGTEFIAGEIATSGAQRSDIVTPPLNIQTGDVGTDAPGWPGAEW